MQWTILSLLNWTTEYFTKHGLENPRLDAEVLLAHTLGLKRLELYLQFERPLGESELATFKAALKRRVQGEPVSYIRGQKEFWSLDLKVGPGVLVPRPDTEVLVEAVLSRRDLFAGREKIRLLDIGTGSGNLAIALAKELPQAQVTTVDVSETALAYARENAARHGLEGRIEFRCLDFLKAVPDSLYDLVVSNPPYIASSVIPTLAKDIKDFEPENALNGGPDGLDFYRKMGEAHPAFLAQGGLLAVEIGEDQAQAVSEIFRQGGLSDLEVLRDYADLDRVVVGKKV